MKTTSNVISISVNATDDCWKKDFQANVELLESRINGYEFGDMPSSFTEVYEIKKVFSKKYESFVGKKCYKWIDNCSSGLRLNNERIATMYNNY